MKQLSNWSLKASLSIVDQGLASASNFGVSVILTRWLSPDEYGAFSLAFTMFLILSGVHNALLIEPMSVLGPARHLTNLTSYLRRVAWAHIALTLALALAGAIGALAFRSTPLGAALLTMSLTSPFVLFFWLVRRAYYLETRPGQAARCSLIYCVTLAVSMAILHRLGGYTASTGFYAMGIAGLASSLSGVLELRLALWRPLSSVASFWETLREHWNYGKWILASALLFPLMAQIQIIVTGTYLGLGAAGVLRALQNPMLPVLQVVIALGTLAIPMLSREFSAGEVSSVYRHGFLLTILMSALALAYEGALLLSGNLWDRVLYGGMYRPYEELMPVLGLLPVFAAVANGATVVMRALQQPKLTTMTYVFGGIFGLVSANFLIRRFGLPGAVYGLVASQLVTAAASVVLILRTRRGLILPRFTPKMAPAGSEGM